MSRNSLILYKVHPEPAIQYSQTGASGEIRLWSWFPVSTHRSWIRPFSTSGRHGAAPKWKVAGERAG